MEKFMKKLPVLAFVLAAFAAFAFNVPAEDAQNTKEALDPHTQMWVDITGQELGTDYNCDEQVETDCTLERDQFGAEIPGSRVEGEYQPI